MFINWLGPRRINQIGEFVSVCAERTNTVIIFRCFGKEDACAAAAFQLREMKSCVVGDSIGGPFFSCAPQTLITLICRFIGWLSRIGYSRTGGNELLIFPFSMPVANVFSTILPFQSQSKQIYNGKLENQYLIKS